MSPRPRGRVGIEPGHGTPVQVTDEQRRAARLVTCCHAKDADDAALLLDALGLLADPEEESR